MLKFNYLSNNDNSKNTPKIHKIKADEAFEHDEP